MLAALLLLRASRPNRAGAAQCVSLIPDELSILDRMTVASDVSEGRPVISWYPGHIAKAERLMSEVLSMVDVVVELRDSRVPFATAHPSLPEWVGKRGHVLVLNRIDAVPQRVCCCSCCFCCSCKCCSCCSCCWIHTHAHATIDSFLFFDRVLSRPPPNGTMRCKQKVVRRHSLSTPGRAMALRS